MSQGHDANACKSLRPQAKWQALLDDPGVFRETHGDVVYLAVAQPRLYQDSRGSEITRSLKRQGSEIEPQRADDYMKRAQAVVQMPATHPAFKQAAGQVFAGGADKVPAIADAKDDSQEDWQRDFNGLIASDSGVSMVQPSARPELQRQVANMQRLKSIRDVSEAVRSLRSLLVKAKATSCTQGFLRLAEDARSALGFEELLQQGEKVAAEGEALADSLSSVRRLFVLPSAIHGMASAAMRGLRNSARQGGREVHAFGGQPGCPWAGMGMVQAARRCEAAHWDAPEVRSSGHSPCPGLRQSEGAVRGLCDRASRRCRVGGGSSRGARGALRGGAA